MGRKKRYTIAEVIDLDKDPGTAPISWIRLSLPQRRILQRLRDWALTDPIAWMQIADREIRSCDAMCDWGLIDVRHTVLGNTARITDRGRRWIRHHGVLKED